MVKLPKLYVITPEPVNQRTFLARVEAILDAGARLLQFRAGSLEQAPYRLLAEQLLSLCRHYNADLILNAAPALVADCGAAGVHLSSSRLMSMHQRPLPRDQWVAASCHSMPELEHAELIGVDFVVVAPVLATKTHPHASPLGWEGLYQLAHQATIPVYALGGMRAEHLPEAVRCGAHGIAAISAVWAARDVKAVIRQCVID